MQIKQENKSFGPKEIPPAGTYPGRLIWIVDMGTHETAYNGEKKNRREVRLTWELTELPMSNPEKFFVVGKKYNATLYKSNLLATIESMTGQPLSFDASGVFDMKSLLGMPCMITVVHKVDDGTTYANVGSVGPIPTLKGKKIDVDAAHNHLISFGLDPEDWDQDTFDMLPEWMQKIIQTSPEYKAIKGMDSIPF